MAVEVKEVQRREKWVRSMGLQREVVWRDWLALEEVVVERVKEVLPMVTCVCEMTSVEILTVGFKADCRTSDEEMDDESEDEMADLEGG